MKSKKNITDKVFALIAVGLIIGGFFCPPMGKIDGSVLTAVGLLLAWHAIDKGLDARVTHGETKVEIMNDDDDDK